MKTVETISDDLDVDVQTVYKWIREKKLKVTRFGNGLRPRIRITDEQLNDFLSTDDIS